LEKIYEFDLKRYKSVISNLDLLVEKHIIFYVVKNFVFRSEEQNVVLK